MKVIKKGSGQKGWAKEITCTGNGNGGGGCGAKLLVEQNDVFQTSSSSYDGSREYYNTFECVECGVNTDIPGSLPFSPKERSKLNAVEVSEKS